MQTFKKNKFNSSNMKKYKVYRHLKQQKKNAALRNAKDENPDDFESFFEQSKPEALFLKKDDVNSLTTYSLEKNIVEVVVKEFLINDHQNLDGDIAMRAFKPVKDETGDVESYTVSVENKAQFDLVLEMISAALAFRKISKVVRSDRENVCAAAKDVTVSPGESSCIPRIECEIEIQALSELMKIMWAFAIGADESNKYGQDAHLDILVRFPCMTGFEGGPDVKSGFHLLTVPLPALAQSGQTCAGLLMMCED